VLLLGGEKVTSLTLNFSSPIHGFALLRVGASGGASLPTWELEAYDRDGKLLDSTGEQHGLPKTPQKFSVRGKGIVRVQLKTDNRYGDSTWATWNSLPVAEFEIEQ